MRRDLYLLSISILAIAGVLAPLASAQPPASQPPLVTQPAAPEPPAASAPAARHEGPPTRVGLEIGDKDNLWGQITLELNDNEAPLTVRNFLRYVEDGFYNGTVFHRVIPDFLIQGGQYTNATQLKTQGLRPAVTSESRNGLKNLRLTVALARAAGPNTGAAQFFINLADNPKLDYPSKDGYGYTVFGKVIDGFDVIEKIAGTPRQPAVGRAVDKTPSLPVELPVIRRAWRLPAGSEPGAVGAQPPVTPPPPPPPSPDPVPQPAPPPEGEPPT
jgi:cyclophilin family peptidyl-prolyl cis-trans isomerase